MTKRRIKLLIVIAVLVIAGSVGFSLLGHRAPDAQPPLTKLDSNSAEPVRQAFNAGSDRTRIILLLSPT